MRIVVRILVVALSLVGILVLGLAASIVIEGLQGPSRLAAITNTAIPGPGEQILAYVARPTTPGPHPGVILVHEFYGLNPAITGKADLLAQQGYVVIAPNLFGQSTSGWIPRAIFQTATTPTENVVMDMRATFNWLASQPDVRPNRIAAAGFCFGGRAALLAALDNPHLAASTAFYGMIPVTPETPLGSIRGPVLGIYGGADASIPLTQVAALEAGLAAAGVPHTITVYPDQPHSFVSDVSAIQAGGAAGEAWQEFVRFLGTSLAATPSPEPATTTDARPAVMASGLDVGYLLSLARLHWGHDPWTASHLH